MTGHHSSQTRRPQPLILIRGFGGLNPEGEKKLAYQGFEQGSVYHHKKGENYIYEGLVLRFLKSNWRYQDATNVVGYYSKEINDDLALPKKLEYLEQMSANGSILPEKLQRLADKGVINKFKHLKEQGFFAGNKIVIDPGMALYLIESTEDLCRSLWVFRYYDLNDRRFEAYGEALVRLIELIQELTAMQDGVKPKVNILAHSMGGLLVRQAVQVAYPKKGLKAEDYINKIVTLGTPHQGVSFQIVQNWPEIDAAQELENFNPDFQNKPENPASYRNFQNHFPPERLLAVVGTNYQSYNSQASALLNRFFSVSGEYGSNYNRSDGLVKQASAQIPGVPRTFVHKSHGGFDSLLTSRESFEIATRFFLGNVRSRLRLVKAEVTRGKDWFGKSEFFFGVSIKPRGVDFELFHQSEEAENCYGPFNKEDLSDENPAFNWADERKLIWEGHLDTMSILEDDSIEPKDMVLRLDFYVGERDLLGIGFSDNLIFRKHYYVRALVTKKPLEIYLHTNERFSQPGFEPQPEDKMRKVNDGWHFDVKGTGFKGTFCIEIDRIPEDGQPQPLS
ncbi:PGAP1-like alpha/beta domain-containing protein [Lyngbya aestuarii]|uniref:PGAP1-like alpha/beta domain-containing protein n=1 Tax=Lyngbya aestuarii TaxID=118322 RepID=UPI00403E0E9E